MLEKRKQALAENAAPHFEQGETVKETMIGQTFITPLAYLLIAPIAFIFMVRQRAVMATDRNVYVLQLNFWKAKQIDQLVTKQPIGSGNVELSSLGIKVGDTDKTYAALFQFEDMKRVAALASGEPAPPAAAQGERA
jgi:hypothetical protein